VRLGREGARGLRFAVGPEFGGAGGDGFAQVVVKRRCGRTPEGDDFDGVEAGQREGADVGMLDEVGDVDPDAETVADADVLGDELGGAGLDGRGPVDFHRGETLAENARDRFGGGKTDQRFVDAVAGPEVCRGFEAGGFRNDENGFELDDRNAFQAGLRAGLERSDGEIDFTVLEPGFELGLEAGAEGEAERGMFATEAFDDRRKVIAQDELGGGEAEDGRLAIADAGGDGVGVVEERAGEIVELLAFGGEAEGLAIEEFRAEVLFELEHLAADGGLLDAVGDVANGAADASMFRDVVEEFEVVEVHRGRMKAKRARRDKGRGCHDGLLSGSMGGIGFID